MYTKSLNVKQISIIGIATSFLLLTVISMLPAKILADPSTVLVSQSTNSIPANKDSTQNLVSDDGRYVAFLSDATNLTSESTSIKQLYYRDTQLGITKMISVNELGEPQNGNIIRISGISGDGRYVFYATNGSSNIQAYSGGNSAIFKYDTLLNQVSLVSVDENGDYVGSDFPIGSSYDGSIIVYSAYPVNSSQPTQYLRNYTAGTVNSLGNSNINGGVALISSDGSYVIQDRYDGIYLINVQNDVSYRVDMGENGEYGKIPGLYDAWSFHLSGGADRLLFFSTNPSLTSNTYQGCQYSGCLYSKDLNTNNIKFLGEISQNGLTASRNGEKIAYQSGNYSSGIELMLVETSEVYGIGYGISWTEPDKFAGQYISLSGQGEYIIFQSEATNLGTTSNCFINVEGQIRSRQCALIYKANTEKNPNSGGLEYVLDSVADTNVRSGQSNRNYGGLDYMRLQSSGSNRGLVGFDQSAIASAVGSGTVTSAKLRLTITDNGNNWGDGRTVDVHRIISEWAEGNGTENSRGTGNGATWECAIDTLIQNQAKDCSGSTLWEMGQPNNPSVHPWIETATATQTITNGQSGVVEFDVTADVQAFLSGSVSNYGWIVKKTNEGQNGQVSFGTKESGVVPQLVITYQP